MGTPDTPEQAHCAGGPASSDAARAADGEQTPTVRPERRKSRGRRAGETQEDQVILARTVVRLADTLAEDFDLDRSLALLAAVCSRLVPGADTSILLADEQNELRVAVATSEPKRVLDQYQVEQSEGPCVDAFRTGRAAIGEALDAAETRWPKFAPLSRAAGYASVHTVPLRLRDETIGVLSLADPYGHRPSPLQVEMLRTLAESATIGILHQRQYDVTHELAQQLQGALTTRILIEQAKGVIAASLGISTDESFELLRRYSRHRNRRIHDVARYVIDGELDAAALRPE
jgi:GAF domain-containing protein